MNSIYREVLRELDLGHVSGLVTVMDTDGSAPGKPGDVMAVFADRCAGTVGGGTMEFLSAGRAAELMKTPGASRREDFSLRPGDEANMICGGMSKALFETFSPEDAPFVRQLADAAEESGPRWYARRLENGSVSVRRIIDGTNFNLDFPEKKLLSAMNGSAAYIPGDPGWFASRLTAAKRAIVFGGGHVAAALSPLLAKCGFPVTVCEDRPEFAVPERFPGVDRVLACDYSRLPDEVIPGPLDFAVVMTHGHSADFEILCQILKTKVSYIGCIGSRKKAEATRQRLADMGFSPEDIARIKTPIGLDIGAETPAEIAVSVAAEMIQARAESGL